MKHIIYNVSKILVWSYEVIPCKKPASVAHTYARPTGDQEIVGLILTGSANILS